MAKRLTMFIAIGLVLGLIVGWGINLAIDDGSAAALRPADGRPVVLYAATSPRR